MAGSASSWGSACKFTTWSLKGMVGTLGTYPGRGLRTTWESAGPNSRHESSTENACRSPTLLTVANAERSTVFRDRNLSSTDCRGSNGAPLKADRTEGRSQEGTRWGRGGFSLLAPLRNLMTRSSFHQRLTVYYIVMCGNSGDIHFEGGGRQPSLQPILQKRKHDCDRASTGVLPAGRTPIDEQVPLQPVSLSRRQNPGRSDSVYYRWR